MLKKKFYFFFIIAAFTFSILLSTYVFINHDREYFSKSSIQYNNLIKGDSAYYFLKARQFQKNIDDKNVLFFSGENSASFLYPILIGSFYYLFDQNVFNTDEIKEINPPNPTSLKLFFLALQSFFYFFSVFFLVKKLNKLDKEIISVLFLFLIFEPTIFQYHSLFMTESFSISFLNFFLGILVKPPNKLVSNFFFGLFVGIMCLIKTVFFYILIPTIIYYVFYFKKKLVLKILSIFLGFALVIILLGYSNFYRSGYFYIMPTQANDAIYWYLADPIYSKNHSITSQQAQTIKQEREDLWIKKNNINLSSEIDRIKLSIYKKQYTIKIIKDAPFITFKHVLWKTFQFLIINPFHLSSYLNMNMVDKDYWKLDNFKLILTLSIIYSLLFYFIVLIGFLKSFKILDTSMNILFLTLFIYFTLLLGWTGSARYNLTNITLFSIYFSVGFKQLHNKFFTKQLI
jgi:hypothetical protein